MTERHDEIKGSELLKFIEIQNKMNETLLEGLRCLLTLGELQGNQIRDLQENVKKKKKGWF